MEIALAARPLGHFLRIPDDRLPGARQPRPTREGRGGVRRRPPLNRETAGHADTELLARFARRLRREQLRDALLRRGLLNLLRELVAMLRTNVGNPAQVV